jgi:hypothetical protein
MPLTFDPGICKAPFTTLANAHPGSDIYPFDDFRVEWGPIFHRGRLDGSARVLVIGQDPAQHETVVRRILVGEAGRRTQGFLAKLGITRSYVMINTFLYSVYGTVGSAISHQPALIDYRNRWIDAIMHPGKVQAVVTLGTQARDAWARWKATPTGTASTVAHAAITHPTQPESSSNTTAERAQATARMLANWNIALQALAPAITRPDAHVPLALYGTAWAEGDRVAIPSLDMPAGLPDWMHENDGWAVRAGTDDPSKRRNITITVPDGLIP